MRNEEILTGIVLYAADLKEYDKRLTVLTREHGKITVFANGARRPNSTLRAACMSFTMGRFTVYPGRDSYTMSKAEITESFDAFALDIEKMCYASYFCEMMSYYTREGDFCVNHLNLLYLAFSALIKGEIPEPLIKNIYELKLMDLEGEGPHALSCVRCGAKEGLRFFSVKAGGVLCEKCAGELKEGKEISKTLLYTLGYILTSPLNKLFSFQLTKEAAAELSRFTEEFMARYIDTEFKALDILKGLL